MGLTSSTESKQEKEENRLNNIKKLFNNDDNTDDILDTLNLTEFKKENKTVVQKKNIPLVGGGYDEKDDEKDDDKDNKNNFGNKRYTKYDLFKMLRDIDSEYQRGGKDGDDDENTSLDDDKSLEHIKSIILKELDNLKNNKSKQLGGNGCGCDGTKSKHFSMKNVEIEDKLQNGGAIIIDDPSSSTSSSTSDSSSSEVGKKPKAKKAAPKKTKKTKANKKINKSDEDEVDDDDNSSRFFIETSESGVNGLTSNGDFSENGKKKRKSKKSRVNKNKDETDDDEEENNVPDDEQEDESEGLSIFPFNSSDVKSSLSVKNYRMLRRKI